MIYTLTKEQTVLWLNQARQRHCKAMLIVIDLKTKEIFPAYIGPTGNAAELRNAFNTNKEDIFTLVLDEYSLLNSLSSEDLVKGHTFNVLKKLK